MNSFLQRRNKKIILSTLLVFSLFFLLFAALQKQILLQRAAGAVTITIDLSKPIMTNSMGTGANIVQTDTQAFTPNGTQLIKTAFSYNAVHIMGFGTLNPEPAPGQYDWSTLDKRVQLMRDTGSTKIITLCCAPDWMKGGSAGQTDWTKIETAPLPAHYADFAALAKQVALRYPDVQYFQVWNELKGFYNSSLNRWNYEGYTNFYNQVYDAIKSVRPNAKIGGPYVVVANWKNPHAGGFPAKDPSLLNQSWGYADQRSLDVISYWLANKHGADFLIVDGNTEAREGGLTTDEFTDASFFTAITNWIRSQPNGGQTLPIAWAEWYATAKPSSDPAYFNAVIMHNYITTLLSGASYALLWGVQGDSTGLTGKVSYPEGIMTNAASATPLYNSMKLLKDFFPPGTPLYKTTSSSKDVTALASKTKILLVNHLATTLTVVINGFQTSLNPYQVVVIDIPVQTVSPSIIVSPTEIPSPTLLIPTLYCLGSCQPSPTITTAVTPTTIQPTPFPTENPSTAPSPDPTLATSPQPSPSPAPRVDNQNGFLSFFVQFLLQLLAQILAFLRFR